METGSTFFAVFSQTEPPPTLCTHILSRIARSRQRAARTLFAIQTAICFLTGMILVPLAQNFGEELYASGFDEYLSLFFSSDASTIAHLWRDVGFSLVESIPSFALLGICIATIVLVWSLRHMQLNSKAAFRGLSIPA